MTRQINRANIYERLKKDVGTFTNSIGRKLWGRVVQLVRMPACHAGGRRFEPVPGRQCADVAQRIPSISSNNFEGFPSGQRGRTVNPLALLSMVRIHPPRPINMRKWLRGRASPCQGEGREFESRLPLHFCGCSSMVELQPSKLIA